MNDQVSDAGNGSVADEWAAALEEQLEDKSGSSPGKGGSGNTDYARAQFQELKAEERTAGHDINMDVILDIPVTVSMEIGRTMINIRQLLQLNQGSVVELDRLAGEPMDVLVNGTLIAHGEVVVVNDKFGIRLTDVISPAERVKKLK